MGNKQFIDQLQAEGLESLGLFYGIYPATVFDNKDPENLGRLQVKSPFIYGDTNSEQWLLPAFQYAGNNAGFLNRPEIGDSILIMFLRGDTKAGMWAHGWWPSGKNITEANAQQGQSPTVRIWRSPAGHKVIFDDKAGEQTLNIQSAGGGQVVIKDAANTVTIIAPNGKHIHVTQSTVNLGVDNPSEPGVLGNKNEAALNQIKSSLTELKTALTTYSAAQQTAVTAAALVTPAFAGLVPALSALNSAIAAMDTGLTALGTQIPQTKSNVIKLE